MSFGDLWNRTLVYFGIAEEDDDYYEDDEIYEPGESLEQSYRERPNVRQLTPRRRSQGYDDWTESEEPAAAPAPRSTSTSTSSGSSRGVRHMTAVPNPGAVATSSSAPMCAARSRIPSRP